MHTPSRILSLVLAFCATASLAQNTKTALPLSSVVQAESSFARTSMEKGMASAFTAFLSDDAVIFRPHPVNGQEWFRSHPSPPISLSWTPGFADVSVTGDLGYTTGPYVARAKTDPTASPAYGDFVTIWKKEGTAWKVKLDLGISHQAPAVEAHLTPLADNNRPSVIVRPDSGFRAAEWSKLRSIEQTSFGDSLHYVPIASLVSLLSPDARIFRPGHFPVVGSDSAKRFFDVRSGTFFRRFLGGALSRGADLAYTYGSYRLHEKDAAEEKQGYYLTVWKKEGTGEWNIALDLESASLKKQ
jgi:ketosteroid isomerase-like protein